MTPIEIQLRTGMCFSIRGYLMSNVMSPVLVVAITKTLFVGSKTQQHDLEYLMQ